MDKIIEKFQNFNKNDNNNKDNFKNILIKLQNSLNTLRNNQLNLTNIETIKKYLSSKIIIGLPVFIIETEKLKYCFDTINQLQGILNDFSFCLSDNDLIILKSMIQMTFLKFFFLLIENPIMEEIYLFILNIKIIC
jgi:hypothetical protein